MKTTPKVDANVKLDFEEMDHLIQALSVLREIDYAMDDNHSGYLAVGDWAIEKNALYDAIELLDNLSNAVHHDNVIEIPEDC